VLLVYFVINCTVIVTIHDQHLVNALRKLRLHPLAKLVTKFCNLFQAMYGEPYTHQQTKKNISKSKSTSRNIMGIGNTHSKRHRVGNNSKGVNVNSIQRKPRKEMTTFNSAAHAAPLSNNTDHSINTDNKNNTSNHIIDDNNNNNTQKRNVTKLCASDQLKAERTLQSAVNDVKEFISRIQSLTLRLFPEINTRLGRYVCVYICVCVRERARETALSLTHSHTHNTVNRDVCNECIQETVFPIILSSLFSLYKRVHLTQDHEFSMKITSLQGVTTKELGVS